MMVPTVHLNGTSRAALLEQVQEAGSAVTQAIRKLEAAWPNGRDYYPQGDTALTFAVAEWRARLDKLTSVRADLEAIAESIER